MRKHGGSGCFAVSSRYCNRHVIIAHDLSQKLGSCEHGKIHLLSFSEFRIVRMDSSSVYNSLNGIGNIGGALSVVDFCAFFFQSSGKRAFFCVRAGDGKSLFKKNLSQSAHTDTADANKMNSHRFFEVYLIHSIILLFIHGYVPIITLSDLNEKCYLSERICHQ